MSKQEEIQKLSMLLEALNVSEIRKITSLLEKLVKKKFQEQS